MTDNEALMKRLILVCTLFLLFIFIGIFTTHNSTDQKSDPQKTVIQSDALKALDFWSSQRAYPNQSIPKANFYQAFEYSKNHLKKSADILKTSDTWQSIGPRPYSVPATGGSR